jgi:hypothetical protein
MPSTSQPSAPKRQHVESPSTEQPLPLYDREPVSYIMEEERLAKLEDTLRELVSKSNVAFNIKAIRYV